MLEVINVYRIDPTNIGDANSTPTRYFDWLASALQLDIESADYDEYQERLAASNVIVGGGGIFSHFQQIEDLYKTSPRALIAWGAGHNLHGKGPIIPDPGLKRFNLVGMRDFGIGYEWVPCSSCLDPVFGNPSEPMHEVAVYEHKDRPLGIDGPPLMTNREEHIEKVAAFLGSAATIITNSYHGVYWATLLQRRVVVVNDFSTKFQAFKHPPTFASIDGWQSEIKKARVYDEALEECRAANLQFSERVKNLLEL